MRHHAIDAPPNVGSILQLAHLTALRGVAVAEALVEAEYKIRFEQAMDDVFNTPVALAVFFDLARDLNLLSLIHI